MNSLIGYLCIGNVLLFLAGLASIVFCTRIGHDDLLVLALIMAGGAFWFLFLGISGLNFASWVVLKIGNLLEDDGRR